LFFRPITGRVTFAVMVTRIDTTRFPFGRDIEHGRPEDVEALKLLEAEARLHGEGSLGAAHGGDAAGVRRWACPRPLPRAV